jgi:CO dehydrogenase maturation factor
MGIKIAISGKGGVGKTTLSALLARALAHRGKRVIAVDADPVTNLGASLGLPEDKMPTPISELKDLIMERTGAQPGTFGGYFKMNPRVDDIPEKFAAESPSGVKLLVMGTVEKGGSGCVCPESVLLKNLIQHLLLSQDDAVIMDMEAGVEHLGRATSRAVNVLLVVVDAGSRSHYAARKIRELAADLGVTRIKVIGNRIRSPEERESLKKAMAGFDIIGFMPEDDTIREADRRGDLAYPDITDAPAELTKIVDRVLDPAP